VVRYVERRMVALAEYANTDTGGGVGSLHDFFDAMRQLGRAGSWPSTPQLNSAPPTRPWRGCRRNIGTERAPRCVGLSTPWPQEWFGVRPGRRLWTPNLRTSVVWFWLDWTGGALEHHSSNTGH